MTDDRFDREQKLFDAALEVASPQRSAFLEAACGGDHELRDRVQRLIHWAERDTGEFGLEATDQASLDEPRGTTFGPYRVLQRIGEGGFGAVYRARQERPVRRTVALKIIKLGMDTKEVIARFEAERQALAMMDHPHIARVFDAGATDSGRPYFVMELVEGVPVTVYCDQNKLGLEDRLELLMLVCEAVQHAHQKGIIHRDLKPSNVLVAGNGTHVPKVIDFGIAKATRTRLTEHTLYTISGQLVGTPAYMSPEQAETGETDIDTRSDIYSLGVLLYELLAGTTPFDAQTFERLGYPEIQRIIRETEPPTPSTRASGLGEDLAEVAGRRRLDPASLPRLLRGDLDWIVMKALEKDRRLRYPTASDLAGDIGRYLRYEPAMASPPRAAYRMRKFVRRHRLGVTAGAVVAFALLVAVGGMTWGLARALRAEVKALSDAERATQVSDLLVGLFGASDPIRTDGNSITAREILDQGAEKIRNDRELQPLVRAQLIQTIGNTYRSLALWNEARSMLEEALAIYRAELGDNDERVGEALHHLAWINLQAGDRVTARRQLELAIEIYERTNDPDDAAVGFVRYFLANVLRDAGEHQAARTLYERVLKSQEDFYGGDNINVGWTLTNFGELLEVTGEYEAARAMHERALRILETSYGPDNVAVTYVLTDLAKVFMHLGEFERARPLYERNLAIRERAYGPDHPHTGWALMGLGRLLMRTGEYERAQELLERSLAVFDAADRTSRVYTINSYGPLLVLLGDFERAAQLYELSLQILEEHFEPNHLELAKTLHGLAALHRQQGRYDLAEPLLERALAIRRAKLPPDHPDLTEILIELDQLRRDPANIPRGDGR
jgi:serine/threonine protein kinase/tetratricopeptide (TPR) repeat protein